MVGLICLAAAIRRFSMLRVLYSNGLIILVSGIIPNDGLIQLYEH